MKYTFEYYRNSSKIDQTHHVFIKAASPSEAWRLFEATYPPRLFTVLSFTEHRHTVKA
jgi:hypothetical protein